MFARPLLPNGMVTAQTRDLGDGRNSCTYVTALATAPGGLLLATIAHSLPHRSLSNPAAVGCGTLQLRRSFTFRPAGDTRACTRHLHPGALALRAALRAAITRSAAAAALPAAAVWEVAAAVVEGLAYDFEALAVDLETAAVQQAAGKEALQAMEKELEKNNSAAGAGELRNPEVEQVRAPWRFRPSPNAGEPCTQVHCPVVAECPPAARPRCASTSAQRLCTRVRHVCRDVHTPPSTACRQ